MGSRCTLTVSVTSPLRSRSVPVLTPAHHRVALRWAVTTPSFGPRLCEMTGTIWFAILTLLAVLTFAALTRLAPYGSPAEVIKTFYFACNSGNYSVAERLLVPEANRVLNRHLGAVGGGLPEICDEETKQRHLQKVVILHENVRGELAQVRYMLYYADGTTTEDRQWLVARYWVWKIAP